MATSHPGLPQADRPGLSGPAISGRCKLAETTPTFAVRSRSAARHSRAEAAGPQNTTLDNLVPKPRHRQPSRSDQHFQPENASPRRDGTPPGEHPPGRYTDRGGRHTCRAGLPHDSSTGQVIAGRVPADRCPRRGGMGTVYRAEQTQPVRRPGAAKADPGRPGLGGRSWPASMPSGRALALDGPPGTSPGSTTAAPPRGRPAVLRHGAGQRRPDHRDYRQTRKRLPLRGKRLELFVA